jgi:hypothetical protein
VLAAETGETSREPRAGGIVLKDLIVQLESLFRLSYLAVQMSEKERSRRELGSLSRGCLGIVDASW